MSEKSTNFTDGISDGTMRPTQIGIVRTQARERKDVRRGGATAVIQVFEPFWPALDQIEFNTHILVFGWLHQADRTILRTRPRKVAPFADERGVFASRSPDRPTPVAMTVVPLLGRRGGELDVDDLDFIDGTPVIDLKPYCPGWDSVFSAEHRRRANPNLQTDEVLREFYRRDFINHVGRGLAGSRLESLSVEACLAATRRFRCDPRDPELKILLFSADGLIDGMMAITGASVTNGRLRFLPGNRKSNGSVSEDAEIIGIERGGERILLEAQRDGFWKIASEG